MNNIAFHKITKRFGRLLALDAVDVSIKPSEVLLVAGPNGAGKSTMINIMLGLYLPDGGEIRIDGTSAPVDNKLKTGMGYLPENVAFSENLSGWTMMSFFARSRGIGKARMKEVMARIGLDHAAKRSISGYSKGMRQRLALGIAILHEPKFLILDEPTSGLDQEGLGVLWSVIDEWRGKGRMILISSHDLGILEKHVDIICILRQGSVVAHDAPPALRQKAALPVKVCFSLDPASDSHSNFVRELTERFHSESIVRDPVALRIEIDPSRLVELMTAVFSQDQQIVQSMQVVEPALEEIYEHLLELS